MKYSSKLILSLLSLWLLSSGCHPSKKLEYSPDTIVPTDQSLLWRISGNGLKQPSYLFGTIHLIPKADLNFSQGTLNALNRSKKIVFEIDIKEMTSLRTQFSLMNKAFMKGGKTLKNLLPEEDYALVKQKMKEKGLPSSMFERLKPLFLSTMLSSDETENPLSSNSENKMTSVEMELWKIAKKQGLKSGGLETADFQMAVFDSIPYEDQAKMLVESLKSNQSGGNELAEMVALYKAEDITGMQKIIAETESMGAFENLLLGNRNQNWIPKMDILMQNQSTFFAVGAGHLGGNQGVIALLRKKGYQVEAVK